jgi:hypothetical protein
MTRLVESVTTRTARTNVDVHFYNKKMIVKWMKVLILNNSYHALQIQVLLL